MTTKYYFNGKLVRTSKSAKLSYNFAIYNENDGQIANFSKDSATLYGEIARQIKNRRYGIELQENRIATKKSSSFRPYNEAEEQKVLAGKKERLDWWMNAKVVKLEKVVTD